MKRYSASSRAGIALDYDICAKIIICSSNQFFTNPSAQHWKFTPPQLFIPSANWVADLYIGACVVIQVGVKFGDGVCISTECKDLSRCPNRRSTTHTLTYNSGTHPRWGRL